MEYSYNNGSLVSGYRKENTHSDSFEFNCENNENIGNICLWEPRLYDHVIITMRMVGLFGKTSKFLVSRRRISSSYKTEDYYYHYIIDPDGYVSYMYCMFNKRESKYEELELTYENY